MDMYSHNFWPHRQDDACYGLVDRPHLLSASDLRLQAQDPPLDGGVQVDYAAPSPLHWYCNIGGNVDVIDGMVDYVKSF